MLVRLQKDRNSWKRGMEWKRLPISLLSGAKGKEKRDGFVDGAADVTVAAAIRGKRSWK
jgi:hypothetical protein